jgi:hypothetical protein
MSSAHSTATPHAALQRDFRAASRSRWIVAAAALWVAGIAYGINTLRVYESTPGALGVAPSKWPAASSIRPIEGKATLVMVVHPQCSCTHAGFEELASLMDSLQGRVAAWVVVADEGEFTLRKLPGVTVMRDVGGREARRFGALTSGSVVLYGTGGNLLFSGGITAARGHAGDNVGIRQLAAALDAPGGAAGSATYGGARTHPVFGCSL